MNRLNLLIFLLYLCGAYAQYEPTWDSLDTRALPSWYDEAKFGIFIHWGVFSVPSYGSEWFWQRWKQENYSDFINFMKQNYPPTFTYQDFARDFKTEFYDADQWADIFANSGAKYVVLTTKHHEGYTLWPSKYSYSWNAVDLGPGRDLVGELATSVKAKNLTFGVYHSLYEWFNPLWNSDRDSNFTKQDFVNDKIFPAMKELVEAYEPSIFWSDGEAEALDTYWRAQEFLAWLYNESPVKKDVVVNDRWGAETQCKHGGFYTCGDRFNSGVLLPHKWENCMTIDKQSWGFRRNADISDYLTTKELLNELVSTVSCGGNLLLNVGPTKDGIIAPIFQERLQELGEWLKINGEAIYATKPWTAQNDSLTSDIWYTSKGSTVYATTLNWAENNVLSMASTMGLFKDTNTIAYLLGNEDNGALSWTLADDAVKIKFPDMAKVKSQWAYVVKIVPGASPAKREDKYGLN